MSKRPDPITIAQRILRRWCKESGVVVDALAGANLIAEITSAIIEDRTKSG